jgi:hypothetical protein
VSAAQDAYLDVIKTELRSQPRSLQKRIGPSELGTACTHCLAAKLAGWEKHEQGVPWLPALGTWAHAGLAEAFLMHPGRYLVETAVMCGWVGDEEIWGSSDLFDTLTGTVEDHKLVGVETLRSARGGPSPVYKAQLNLYGLGFVNAGHDVHRVAISYLPRNAVTLDAAVWWEDDYRPELALAALDRANEIASKIAALRSISPEAVDPWIGTLERADRCFDCARFADAPHETSTLRHLVTTH